MEGFLIRGWNIILPRCGGTSTLSRAATFAARADSTTVFVRGRRVVLHRGEGIATLAASLAHRLWSSARIAYSMRMALILGGVEGWEGWHMCLASGRKNMADREKKKKKCFQVPLRNRFHVTDFMYTLRSTASASGSTFPVVREPYNSRRVMEPLPMPTGGL